MQILIHLLLIFLDHPEIVSFGLQDLQTQLARSKNGISTDERSTQIESCQQQRSRTDLTSRGADLDLCQDNSLFGEVGRKQMDALCASKRNRAS
ncbi:hypothetical protein KSD_69450 [Ktedonobacter sp. SOSP1-85]|nr:hypothetical protein KSD_69450 [Ktedonobacter sp. SOSP1-85]